MFVYVITNKINGKQYVGQHSGSDLNKYWKRNITWALNNQGHKVCLYNAIRKYGPESFSCLPIVLVDSKEEMDLYEQILIQALDTKSPNGYNLTDGGEGTPGHSVSEEGRRRMSAKKIGRPSHRKGSILSVETKLKISEAKTGVKLSEEHRAAITLGQIGGKRSDETKRKMSESGKKGWEKRRLLAQPVSKETRRLMSEAHKKYWVNKRLGLLKE
jgi:group I intron endonuclease